MACSYWMMTTHLILFITQLLSVFGIAAAINVQAWMYVGLANMVVMMVLGMVHLYAFNLYWDVAEDSSDASEVADAELAMTWMKLRKYVEMAFGSHYMLALYMNHMPWMMAQWMALDEDTQKAW